MVKVKISTTSIKSEYFYSIFRVVDNLSLVPLAVNNAELVLVFVLYFSFTASVSFPDCPY